MKKKQKYVYGKALQSNLTLQEKKAFQRSCKSRGLDPTWIASELIRKYVKENQEVKNNEC